MCCSGRCFPLAYTKKKPLDTSEPMQKICLPLLTGLTLVALVGALVYVQNRPSARAESQSAVVSEEKTYTLAAVAGHADISSCWTVINGKVYDLTAWIASHPGGERAILGLCGTDGTAAFEGRHGGQGEPEATLASFTIGVLSN